MLITARGKVKGKASAARLQARSLARQFGGTSVCSNGVVHRTLADVDTASRGKWPGYRDVSGNLRTQLHRIIERAGLIPWPKTFHNLRSTRQTELSEDFPAHVVCAWLGNSEDVAKDHYLQV